MDQFRRIQRNLLSYLVPELLFFEKIITTIQHYSYITNLFSCISILLVIFPFSELCVCDGSTGDLWWRQKQQNLQTAAKQFNTLYQFWADDMAPSHTLPRQSAQVPGPTSTFEMLPVSHRSETRYQPVCREAYALYKFHPTHRQYIPTCYSEGCPFSKCYSVEGKRFYGIAEDIYFMGNQWRIA